MPLVGCILPRRASDESITTLRNAQYVIRDLRNTVRTDF